MIYKHSFFGEIDLEELEEFYEEEIQINGKNVTVDLNFNGETYNQSDIHKLDLLNSFIKSATDYEMIAKKEIVKDFENNGVTKEYIEHHLEDLSDEELIFLGIDDKSEKQIQVLKKLTLKRIGFYPEEGDSIMVLDFSIGYEITQYLIVVNFDINGQLIDGIIMES